MSEATTTELQSFARRHQLTLNTVLQAAWAFVLHRYSGSEDVVFGTTVSGRPVSPPEIQETVGIFINTLPVRIQVPFDGLLSTSLSRASGQAGGIRETRTHPADPDPGMEPSARGTPLFESVLVLLNYPITPALQQSQKDLTLKNPIGLNRQITR